MYFCTETEKPHITVTVFFIMISLTSFVFPLLIFGLLLFFPCLPTFPGAIFFTCDDSPLSIQDWINRLLMAFLGGGLLIPFMASATFSGIHGLFLKLLSLLEYIEYLEKESGVIQKQKPLNLNQINRMIMKYKQLQLISSRFNGCYQWHFFSVTLTIAQVMGIAVFYSLVTLLGKIHVLVYIGIIFCGADTFFFIGMVVWMSGSINFKSSAITKYWQTVDKMGRRNKIRKAWIPCHALKIKFGTTNFIEKSTVLTVLGFCVSQTATLLLLQ